MKNTGKGGPKGNSKPATDVRRDRKSGTGMSGSPKKGGHGGKYTWSGDGYSKAEMGFEKDVAAIDAKDPIFEDHAASEESVGS